jgi:hypothetical protein
MIPWNTPGWSATTEILCACGIRILLGIRNANKKHTPKARKHNIDQSHATTQASHGLEGPQPSKTTLLQGHALTNSKRVHLLTITPKRRLVGGRPGSAQLPVRPNCLCLLSPPAATWWLQDASPSRFYMLGAELPAANRPSKTIITRGVPLNEYTKI